MLITSKNSPRHPLLLGVFLLNFLIGCRESDPGSGKEISPPRERPISDNREMREISPEEDWHTIDDPDSDGWTSEVQAQDARQQLERLAALVLAGTPVHREDLEPLLDPGFRGTGLVPAKPATVFTDSSLRVDRAEKIAEYDGDFVEAIRAAKQDFEGASSSRYKVKVLRVSSEPGETTKPSGFATVQLVSLTARSPSGIAEHHGRWIARWTTEGNGPPRLQYLEVRDFERTRADKSWFEDCTSSMLADSPSYSSQLMRGMNHWLERIPYRAALNRMGTPGLTIGDVNGDGLEDLYLCQEPGLPNLLFLQRRNGTLEEVSSSWGVDWLQDSRSALLVDLDNDGRQDLAVAIFGALVLARNEGNRFRVQTILPASESTTSLTSVDYDRDGKLDLYLCAYSPDRSLESTPQALGPLGARFVFHDAENGSPNTLFRNESSPGEPWAFSDVTNATGLDAHNTRWTFAAAWEDFDNDGDPDLYLANDYGRNCLFVNDSRPGGMVRFHNIAPDAGAEDSASGMSVAWGDYDRDGWMDVYISNMFSAAGNRVTSRPEFKPSISPTLRRKFQHFARGNTLLRNLGGISGPSFLDTSTPAGVTIGRWAWSSLFTDLNNDGWEDLVVANGYLTGSSGGDL